MENIGTLNLWTKKFSYICFGVSKRETTKKFNQYQSIYSYLVNDFSGSFETICSWYASCCWRYLRLIDELLILSSLRCWYIWVPPPYRSFESHNLILLLTFAEVSEDLVLPLRLIIEAGFRIVQSRTDSNNASILICRFSSGWSSTQSLQNKFELLETLGYFISLFWKCTNRIHPFYFCYLSFKQLRFLKNVETPLIFTGISFFLWFSMVCLIR